MSQLGDLGNPPMAFAPRKLEPTGVMVRATQARGYVQSGTRARPRPTPAPRAAPQPTRWNPAVRSARPQPTRTRTVTRTRAQPVPRRQAPRAQPAPAPRTRTRTVRRAQPQPIRRAPQPPIPPQSSFLDRALASQRLAYDVAKRWAEEKARLAYNDMVRNHIRGKRDEALRATQSQKQAAVRRSYGKQAAGMFGKLSKNEQDALWGSGVQDSYSAALTKHVKRRRRTR